jgi:hypothetical protein
MKNITKEQFLVLKDEFKSMDNVIGHRYEEKSEYSSSDDSSENQKQVGLSYQYAF